MFTHSSGSALGGAAAWAVDEKVHLFRNGERREKGTQLKSINSVEIMSECFITTLLLTIVFCLKCVKMLFASEECVVNNYCGFKSSGFGY